MCAEATLALTLRHQETLLAVLTLPRYGRGGPKVTVGTEVFPPLKSWFSVRVRKSRL